MAKVVNNTVYDAEGGEYPTRHVIAVPSRTGEVSTTGLGGGSVVFNRVRMQLLEPFKRDITQYLGTQTLTIHNVARFMKTLSTVFETRGLNYKKSLLLLGFIVTPDGRVSAPHTPAPAIGEPGAPSRRQGAKQPVRPPTRRLGFKQPGP